MDNIVTDSIKYPTRGDTLPRILVVGGVFMFAYELFLEAVLLSVTPGDGVVTGPFGNGAPVAVQGVLVTFGLLSFVVLSGFYVRIAEHVLAGAETPPGFSDGKRLVSDGALFCVTLLAIVAVVLVVQLAFFVMLVGLTVVVEAVLGIPSIGIVLSVLWLLFVVVPVAITTVYPQPSIWILVARFRLQSETGGSYLRFVASRRFLSELGSILSARKYATSWAALVVVSMLQGAATVQGGNVFESSQPVDLVFSVNARLVSALVGFYVSVAVVYIFAFRFRDPDRSRQTSFREFQSPRESGPTKDGPRGRHRP